MKIKGIIKDIQIGHNLKPQLVIETVITEQLEKLQGKNLIIDIKEEKSVRSISANNYYWSILTELKDILNIPLMELHLKMLQEYGQGTYVKIDRKAKGYFERTLKYFLVVGETAEEIEYLVLLGSSEMNTKEFSRLLNGLLQEAETQGIETLETMNLKELIKKGEIL